jgi:peptide/nickel transport system permease protein
MGSYVARRLLQGLATLFAVSVVTFAMLVLAPGDPVILLVSPEQMASADLDVLRTQLGLDRSLPVQYASMMGGLVTGKLRSFRERRPTTEMIVEALGPTALLAAISLLVAVVLSLPIAIVSAVRPYTALDHAVTVLSLMGISLPGFWFALLLIHLFTDRLGWLPASGFVPIGGGGSAIAQRVSYLIMPSTVLCLSLLPFLVRYARSAFRENLGQDYVQVARSKGLSEGAVLLRHVLRNSLIPVVTVVGLLVPFLLSGAVVVEMIFGIPGVGRLAVLGAVHRDYPIVMTATLVSALLVILSSLVTDVCYAWLDPRIRNG